MPTVPVKFLPGQKKWFFLMFLNSHAAQQKFHDANLYRYPSKQSPACWLLLIILDSYGLKN